MEDNTPVVFRPHHFLCALGFSGKGYSPSFVRNFAKIVKRLRAEDGDHVPITVTSITDDVCAPCPLRRDHLCTQQEKISRLDTRHARVLGWQEGKTYTWGEAKACLKQLSEEDFHTICDGCGWKDAGLCLKALQGLQEEQNQ
ncbi:MAG: DUF1284 domain-containing protein [Candidatus Puniceispirillum sp.]|nr:DUF1284 domain-containing protein [Candidatus Puniceispirillum sp.]